MEQKTPSRGRAGYVGPAVRTDWRGGPRTEIWDRLWARILDDLKLDGTERTLAPLGEGDTDD